MLLFPGLVCAVLQALFTLLEVAFGAVSPARLRALAEADPRPDPASPVAEAVSARRVLSLLAHPDRLSLLFIVITSLTLWAAASALTWQGLDQGWSPWTVGAALGGLLFATEVLPLLVGARHPEAVALRFAPVLQGALWLLAPLLAVVGGLAMGVASAFGFAGRRAPETTRTELHTALAAAEEEGVIEKDERELLEGAIAFRDKLVREVMTPRIDVVGVPAHERLEAVLERALAAGHSRLPVYEGSLDHLVGILAVKDLLPHFKSGAAPPLLTARDLARPAFYVPANKRIATTLEELRGQRTLMAVVVDADGGTAGLVTLEDLLEELVGEIQDEYDREEPSLVVRGDALHPVVAGDAGTSVRTFLRFCRDALELRVVLMSQALHVSSPALRLAPPDYDAVPADPSLSLAALALALFDRVPAMGDTVAAGTATRGEGDGDGNDAHGPDSKPYLAFLDIEAMEGPRIERVLVRFQALPEKEQRS